jgi:hypothetical protein
MLGCELFEKIKQDNVVMIMDMKAILAGFGRCYNIV